MWGGLHSCTAADGFGFVTNNHGNIRGSELGQTEDSCAPFPVFPLTVFGALKPLGVLSQFDQFAVQ